MLDKINNIQTYMNARFYERSGAIKMMMVALVGGLPMAMISPPGTGKTDMVEEFLDLIEGEDFTYLMTRYTTPDELLGGVSLPALSQGRDERNWDGKLTTANKVMLDETFKANSGTLNILLSAMQQRKAEGRHTPWICWYGASNELPDGIGSRKNAGDSLEALWDRVIIRVPVEYIKSPSNLHRLLFTNDRNNTVKPDKITIQEVLDLRSLINSVKTDRVESAYLSLLEGLKQSGIKVSDRKAMYGVKFLKILAVLSGMDTISPMMLEDLVYVFNDIENFDVIKETIEGLASVESKLANQYVEEAAKLAGKVEEIRTLKTSERLEGMIELKNKLDEMEDKIDTAKSDVTDTVVVSIFEQANKYCDTARNSLAAMIN